MEQQVQRSDLAARPMRGSHARLVNLQFIPSDSGTLTVAQMSEHIGFSVRRAYFIHGVPESGSRGGHAHKRLRQCFICLNGSVTIDVTKGGDTLSFRLSSPQEALVVDAGCWRDLHDFSSEATVLVLASDEYAESDYIRRAGEFRSWEAEQQTAPVPYLDLSRQYDQLGSEIEKAMGDVLRSGAFVGGQPVTRFEAEFANFCGVSSAVGVGNGLEALSLVLRAWGVGPGDEVIVPAHTFVATALAVEEVGATTVLVDVDADTGLMSVEQTARAITSRTRAMIPVHLYGQPVDIDGLKQVIGHRPIKILEDACQAHGALYKGRPCGSLGDAAAFSFYPTKNLGALGDGGAVTTNDPRLASEVRRIANYGAAKKYHHDVIGVNSRLDALQAAVLSVKLPHLPAANARRRAYADTYVRWLSGTRGIALPKVQSWAEPVWHVFWIRCLEGREPLERFLNSRGIGTNIHYPVAVHEQACFAGRWRPGDFPVAEQLCREVLSLPLDPSHTPEEISRVIATVQAFFDAKTAARRVEYG